MNVRCFSLCFLLCLPLSVNAANCKQDALLSQRARTLFLSGQYLLASIHFSSLIATDCDENIRSNAIFGYALSMSELGETNEVARTLSDEALSQPRFGILKSYLNLSDSQLNKQDLGRIVTWRDRLNPTKFREGVANLNADPTRKELLLSLNRQMIESQQKSLWTAGIASGLLPGAGQAYVGAWSSAAISFALNALFLATTIEFSKREMTGPALAAGLVFSVTYVGSILNAVSLAKTHNEKSSHPYELQLRKELLPELTP